MKKFIYILIVALTASSLLACRKNKKSEAELTEFGQFVQTIYDSESALKGYQELYTIKSDALLSYERTTSLTLERGEVVKTNVTTTEKTLSDSGDTDYVITTTKYRTEGTMKYQEVGDDVFESEYVVPTYFLTFVLAEEYLKEGFTFTHSDNNYSLQAEVLDTKIGAFFLNKSLYTITDLKISIQVTDDKLQEFKASYTSTKGFIVEMHTTYQY